MSLKCILQGQNDNGLKLDNNILKQNNEDVTTQVKNTLNAADATIVSGHITDTSIHVTAEEKEKLAKAVTSSGLVYNSGLPAKPSTPIAANEETSESLVQDGIDVTDKVKNLMTTYTYGTEDLVAGTSLLKTGYLYLVYEE